MEPEEAIFFADREAWRAWLKQHHASETLLWVGFYKKSTGRQRLSYAAAVEEALCFGWVDGRVRKLDEECYAERFTPRKKGSVWSQLNLKRFIAQEKSDRMTDAGRAVIDPALRERILRDGVTEADNPYPKLDMPEELAAVLKKNVRARKAFDALTAYKQDDFFRWVGRAKKPETRQRRADEAIRLLTEGEELGMK